MLRTVNLLLQMCWLMAGLVSPLYAAELTFDGWVDAFSAEWVRGHPNLAATSQYFEGAEQDSLDRQLTPITKEFRASRVTLARRWLSELDKFDRAELTESPRVSAAVRDDQTGLALCGK